MNDAGFGVFLTNLGRYNEGDLIGRWYGLEDFPLEESDIAGDLELDETHEEYFATDWQGCPKDMGEYVSLSTLNDVADWISEQVADGLSEEDVCALLSEGHLGIEDAAEGTVELRLYRGMHTMAEVAEDMWDNGYPDYQEELDSWVGLGRYVALDAERAGRDLEIEGEFVDTKAGIFEIIR